MSTTIRCALASVVPPKPPTRQPPFDGVGAAITRLAVGLYSPDLATSVAWYTSIGFELVGSLEEDGELEFARLALGPAEVAFSCDGAPTAGSTRLWLHTDLLRPPGVTTAT